MRYWKSLLPLTMLSAVGGYANCTGTWTGSTSADWDVASNWSPASCVPGTVANTDTATFTASSGSGYTISLDAPAVSPTLETLTFDSATSYTIHSAGANTLEFTAPSTSIDVLAGSHVITADVSLSNTTWTIDLVSGQLTLENQLTSTASSAVVEGSGTFINLNNASGMSIADSLTMQNGTFNNTATVTPGASSNATSVSVGTNWIINGGTTSNLNQALITNDDSNGALMQISGSLTVNAGTLQNSNTNSVTSSMDGKGTYINAGSFNLNGGTITNSNSGTVTGTNIGSQFASAGAIVISGGSFTNTSSGPATASPATAAQLSGMNNLTMTGGTLTNTGPLGQGNFISISDLFSISGGELINDDTAIIGSMDVSGTALVRGTGLYNSTGALSVSGGIVLYNGTFDAASLNISGGEVKGNGTFDSSGSATVSGGMLRNDGTFIATSLDIGSAGIVKGQGSFQLSGAATVDGKLQISGVTFQATSVNVSGRLSGTGLIEGPGASTTSLTNNGKVKVGNNGGGTFNVKGTYSQSSSATLIVNVASPTLYSLLDVTGSAALDGTLNVGGSDPSISPSGTIIFLSAGGGVSGTFSKVITSLTDLIPQLTYAANSVSLSFFPTVDVASYSFVGGQQNTLNQINFIQTYTLDLINGLIDNINSGGSAVVAMGPFSFDEDELTAQNGDNTQSQTQQLQYELNQGIRELEDEGQEIQHKGRFFKRRAAKKALAARTPWRVYVAESVAKGSSVAQSNSHGSRSWSVGTIVGFDYAGNQWGIGVLTEDNYTFGQSKHHGNFSYSNHLSLSSYVTYVPRQLPNFALNGSAGTGYVWHKKPRKAGHGTGRVTCMGKPVEWECNTMVGGQYTFGHSQFRRIPQNFKFSPEFDLRYSHSKEHSFYEHGGGKYNSKYKHSTVNSLKTNLSTRFDYSWIGNQVNTNLDLYVGWERELIEKHSASIYATIKPFKGYTKLIYTTAKNHFQFSADFTTALKTLFVADLKYQFDWDVHGHSHNLTGKASFKF